MIAKGAVKDCVRAEQEIQTRDQQRVLQSEEIKSPDTSSVRIEEYLSSITSVVEQTLTAIEAGVSIQNPKFLQRAGLPGSAKVREELGVTLLSIAAVGGSIELRIPPKPDIVSQTLDFIGMPDERDPIVCSLKDSSGNMLFELTLDHKDLAENRAVTIASFGQYSGVRRDGELGAWVGQTEGTADWMIECLEVCPDLVTSGSWQPSEMLPKQEATRMEAVARFILQGLQNQALPGLSVDSLKATRAGSEGAADLQKQIDTLGDLTKNVAGLLMERAGLGQLAMRYPRAHVDRSANSITLPTLSGGSSITISAPAPVSFVRRVVNVCLGIEARGVECVFKRAGDELLVLKLNADGEPKLVRCAGWSNLSFDGQNVKGADAAQRKSNSELLKLVMDNTNVHDPFNVARMSEFVGKFLEPPSRALASGEVGEISGILGRAIAGLPRMRP